jgi:hypothetical protein
MRDNLIEKIFCIDVRSLPYSFIIPYSLQFPILHFRECVLYRSLFPITYTCIGNSRELKPGLFQVLIFILILRWIFE